MIKRLYIDNYKCLVNFELDLSEMNLLLGPNGVGKTAIFDVVHAVRQLLTGEAKIMDSMVFPAKTLTRWQQRDVQVLELDVMLDQNAFRYRLEIGHERSRRQSRVELERLDVDGRPLFRVKKGEVQLYKDDHTEGPQFTASWDESALARVAPGPSNVRLTRFLDYIRRIVVCSLHPPYFATESSSEDAILKRDGRNFSAWYRHVILERPELAFELTKSLTHTFDGFRGIRMEKVGLDARALVVGFSRGTEDYELRFDEVSDGQRALIALYALIDLAPDGGSHGYTLFLDEPDNYVSLPEIQPWLMELKDNCGKFVSQAILCSHHPELIDYLGGDCGLVLRTERSGVTKVAPARMLAVDGGPKLSEVISRGWEE